MNIARHSVFVLAVLFVATIGVPSRAADPVKVGPEISVSTGADGYVWTPRVDMDPDGNFLVAWEDNDYGTAKGRMFYANGNAQGPVFQVSPETHYVTTGNFDEDENLSIAADRAGNFVVAYHAYDNDPYNYNYYRPCYERGCIYTKKVHATGLVAPASFIVGDPRINQYQGDLNQTANPEIASDGKGNFVMAWEGYDEYYHNDHFDVDEGVFGRAMVNAGQLNGGTFRMNEYKDGYQGDGGELDIAAADAGNFVVTWYSEASAAYGLVARIFDSKKKPLGPEFLIKYSVRDPKIAITRSGDFFMVAWNNYGTIEGQVFLADGTAVAPIFVIGDGEAPELAVSGADTFIVTWDGNSGVSARVYDTTGTPTGAEFQANTLTDGYYPAVGADALGNFVITWMEDSAYTWAQRFLSEPAAPVEMPVYGKAIVVTNKIPDDPEKNKAKWKAGGENIVSPPRGTHNDPRCNGDPDGTVKAVVRFWSDTSGHDTGAIHLPCQHWVANGPNTPTGVSKRGYKYKDSKLSSGPCNSVVLKGTKSLSVSCKGKKGIRDFPYDLEAGTNEVAVNGLLELGLYRYCSSFPAFGFDGSDGKKFRGKKADAPLAPCPIGYLGQCGNGVQGIDEVCDDGNAADGDYCSADCKAITSVCGDGTVELAEVCDDGNALDGDYCSATCLVVTAVCGDSVIGPLEACDDGNTLDGDYCRADCRRVTAVCGDGAVGPGEVCDDGNTLDGDYCRADCKAETAICGDGLLGPGEVCDDGNVVGGDLCSPDCLTEFAICGDGIVGPGEACDDGNVVGGDYCAADCSEEFAFCGDGIIGPGECCDDGNVIPGDGCDATCDSGDQCPSCPFEPGDWEYCLLSQCGPCGADVGDCDNSTECQPGLTCVHNVGNEYGWSSSVDVCR